MYFHTFEILCSGKKYFDDNLKANILINRFRKVLYTCIRYFGKTFILLNYLEKQGRKR